MNTITEKLRWKKKGRKYRMEWKSIQYTFKYQKNIIIKKIHWNENYFVKSRAHSPSSCCSISSKRWVMLDCITCTCSSRFSLQFTGSILSASGIMGAWTEKGKCTATFSQWKVLSLSYYISTLRKFVIMYIATFTC